jgi:hypothetical protein
MHTYLTSSSNRSSSSPPKEIERSRRHAPSDQNQPPGKERITAARREKKERRGETGESQRGGERGARRRSKWTGGRRRQAGANATGTRRGREWGAVLWGRRDGNHHHVARASGRAGADQSQRATRPHPATGDRGPREFFFLLPSFGSLGFPPPVRPPRRRLETARDWGKFSRAFRRRRRRRQPIMESDGTGEVAGGIRFGSICQVCALAARAGACDAGSRAAPVRGREDSPC